MKTKSSAIRELFEELGVHAKAEDFVYCGTRRVVYDGEFCGKLFHDRQVSKVFYLWFDADESAFNIDPAEVDHVLSTVCGITRFRTASKWTSLKFYAAA